MSEITSIIPAVIVPEVALLMSDILEMISRATFSLPVSKPSTRKNNVQNNQDYTLQLSDKIDSTKISYFMESHIVAVGGIEPHSLRNYLYNSFHSLEFSPNHLVHYSHIALNYLHYFRADILVSVVRNRSSVVPILHQLYSSLYRLEQTLGVDA